MFPQHDMKKCFPVKQQSGSKIQFPQKNDNVHNLLSFFHFLLKTIRKWLILTEPPNVISKLTKHPMLQNINMLKLNVFSRGQTLKLTKDLRK